MYIQYINPGQKSEDLLYNVPNLSVESHKKISDVAIVVIITRILISNQLLAMANHSRRGRRNELIIVACTCAEEGSKNEWQSDSSLWLGK